MKERYWLIAFKANKVIAQVASSANLRDARREATEALSAFNADAVCVESLSGVTVHVARRAVA